MWDCAPYSPTTCRAVYEEQEDELGRWDAANVVENVGEHAAIKANIHGQKNVHPSYTFITASGLVTAPTLDVTLDHSALKGFAQLCPQLTSENTAVQGCHLYVEK